MPAFLKNSFVPSIVFALLIALSHFSVPAWAVERPQLFSDAQGTWWLNIGAGPGGVFAYNPPENSDAEEYEIDHEEERPKGFLTLGASANYAIRNNQLITLRTTRAQGILTCLFGTCEQALDDITEVGLLYGLMHKSKHFLVSGAAGLAYTRFTYNTIDYDYDVFDNEIEGEHSTLTTTTVGLPLETQLFWTPTRFFGIGLIGLANVNNEASFAAGLVGIQIGNLR